MKKHAIIPIFIPHRGCPNDCVFCNQRKITAHQAPVRPEDVTETVETWLSTLEPRHTETIELAFFGGSFTGIPMEEQTAFLKVAKAYKDAGRIHKIHLSTRPDYITPEILDNLKRWSADVIELGVQSFDDQVLRLSGRGHDAACVYESSRMIQEYGFTLGIQLMIGLPGDTMERDLYSAAETVRIGPSIARLYPTVVIRDTALYDMYLAGTYLPMEETEAVERTKEMYKILTSAGINIIRVGLKSSDIIADAVRQDSTDFDTPSNDTQGYISRGSNAQDGDTQGGGTLGSDTRRAASGSGSRASIVPGTFHPAFRQLVEGAIARESLEEQVLSLYPGIGDFMRSVSGEGLPTTEGRTDAASGEALPAAGHCANTASGEGLPTAEDCTDAASGEALSPAEGRTNTALLRWLCPTAYFISSEKSKNNMFGHKSANRKYFAKEYPRLNIEYVTDTQLGMSLQDGQYLVLDAGQTGGIPYTLKNKGEIL